jgi:hypothetical protein
VNAASLPGSFPMDDFRETVRAAAEPQKHERRGILKTESEGYGFVARATIMLLFSSSCCA